MAAAPKPKIDLPAKSGMQTAVLAAGCFWCVETVFERLEGVTDVVSGYAGDTKDNAVYKVVSSGKTKHAEVVKITYDPKKISYATLIQVLFSTADPTTKNGQHPDYGPQYRSAIFYANAQEKKVAEAYIKQVNASKVFPKPIATTIEPLEAFYDAEAYHQDFVTRHPNHPYVRAWAYKKVEKLKKSFPKLLKR